MEQFKLFPKYLASLLLRIFLAILAGTLLLSAVCMIPSAPMDRNLQKSADVFAQEGIYPTLFSWCTSQLDSTTDALILLISACDSGESPVVQAMSGTRNTLSAVEAASDELAVHYGQGLPFDGTEPYYQYWHGYQLVIRPLLSLLDYSGIRILNGIIQTSLLVLLCLLLRKNGMRRYILPYLAAVLMLMPLALAMSLQFSSCYYILTLGSLAVLWKKDSLDKLDGLLFLYIGIATAYFDFLTYPAATLGIPAVFYFCIRRSNEIRSTFCRGVKICFSWAMGYGLMWSGKWLIGSLILKKNILSVAAGKLTERSAADAGILGNIRAALSANLRSFLHTPAVLVVLLLGAVLLILAIRKILKKQAALCQCAATVFPFVILAIIPVAWYMVTAQHAVIHHWFTHKALAVSVFAALAALAKVSKPAE